jgi:hypothetical protein
MCLDCKNGSQLRIFRLLNSFESAANDAAASFQRAGIRVAQPTALAQEVPEKGSGRIAAGANRSRLVWFPEIAPKSGLLIFQIEQY